MAGGSCALVGAALAVLVLLLVLLAAAPRCSLRESLLVAGPGSYRLRRGAAAQKFGPQQGPLQVSLASLKISVIIIVSNYFYLPTYYYTYHLELTNF